MIQSDDKKHAKNTMIYFPLFPRNRSASKTMSGGDYSTIRLPCLLAKDSSRSIKAPWWRIYVMGQDLVRTIVGAKKIS